MEQPVNKSNRTPARATPNTSIPDISAAAWGGTAATADQGAAPYADIHSHGRSPNLGLRILNAAPEALAGELPSNEYLSLGWHPWLDPSRADRDAFARLEAAAGQARVLAIGECGLDRLLDTPLPVQAEIFSEQIRIAERLGKPLIIHCVRAFDELAGIVKGLKPSVPLILHGFSRRVEIARTALRRGYYLSFGADLLRPGSGACHAFRECPSERAFLETDNSDVGIELIYAAASRLGKLNPEELRQAMYDNFRRVFHG